MLSLEGLTAGYDGAPVIRDLELTVDAGEVVALLGPNGAGKTTTLRAISGLVHPLRAGSPTRAPTPRGSRRSCARGAASRTSPRAAACSSA